MYKLDPDVCVSYLIQLLKLYKLASAELRENLIKFGKNTFHFNEMTE